MAWRTGKPMFRRAVVELQQQKTVWILNSFSLNLLADLTSATLSVRRLDVSEARRIAVRAQSAVGHQDTAAYFGDLLERPVALNRVTVRLRPGDIALVGQHMGQRLPVGATSRPAGPVHWILVEVVAVHA